MPVFDRPQLRRRSQSEQVVSTKVALAMTSRAVHPNASAVLAPGTCNPTPPWPCNGDSVRHHKTPLTPDQAIVADIIERKKASLPPKPAAAVLAAAAARKTTRKHVFFSTPTSSIRRSPVLPNDHVTAHPGTGGNMAKYVTPEQHITPPPPPYTPVNAVTHASYSVTSGRPAFEYACTPACDTTRYVPPAPAHLTAGQSTINNVTTIFPSVIAASEALRINLGLECGQTGLLFGGPLHQTGTFGMPLQRSPSIPGVTIPQFQFGVEPAVTRGTGNEATAHTNHYKIFAGLEPLPGMTQPLACLSPNLPPVVNTGHKGPMKVQPGDWSCLVCSFINWRRRKYCMRCCPFAEGNANAHQSMLASMASVHKPLYASMMTASQPTYSVYATPPRQVPMRVAPPLFPAGPSPTTTASTHMLQGQVPYFPLSVGPQTFPTLPALQSPFGPLMSTSGAQTSYREIPTSQATQDVSPSGQADKGRSDSTNLLYDSGYGRYPGDQEKHGFVQDAKIVDVNRPITPSPTGSQSSGCSFAFSSTSAPDVESPTTSIESNGSTSSVSSPDTSSKVIRTPPSSKFRQFEDSQKMLAMSNAVEQDCTDAIEQGLHSFERRNNGLKSSTDNLTSNPQSDQKR